MIVDNGSHTPWRPLGRHSQIREYPPGNPSGACSGAFISNVGLRLQLGTKPGDFQAMTHSKRRVLEGGDNISRVTEEVQRELGKSRRSFDLNTLDFSFNARRRYAVLRLGDLPPCDAPI